MKREDVEFTEVDFLPDIDDDGYMEHEEIDDDGEYIDIDDGEYIDIDDDGYMEHEEIDDDGEYIDDEDDEDIELTTLTLQG